MTAKKAAKKAKTKKAMTVELPPAPVQTEAQEVIAALVSMQATQGWAIVTRILNENIRYLEAAILDKKDPVTGDPIGDAEVETLRTKRALNIELLNTPKKYAGIIEEKGEVPENFDPYFQSREEMDRHLIAPPPDDKGR